MVSSIMWLSFKRSVSNTLLNKYINLCTQHLKFILKKYSVDSVSKDKPLHIPVMVKEVIRSLKPKPGQLFIDMTFGAGGHTQEILNAVPDIKVLALDRDPLAYSIAEKLAEQYPDQIVPLLGKFSDLPQLLTSLNIERNSIDCMLCDFGLSSMQIDLKTRGFSFRENGPLDMRQDGNRFPDSPTARDVLAYADEEDIVNILKVYGDEENAESIAHAVIQARYLFQRLETTGELAALVASVYNYDYEQDMLNRPVHVAKKTFKALEAFVNNHFNEIDFAMNFAGTYLKVGGTLVTLTFNSKEEWIVRRHILGDKNSVTDPPPSDKRNKAYLTLNDVEHSNWKPLHKCILTPSKREVRKNARCHSARLLAATRKK